MAKELPDAKKTPWDPKRAEAWNKWFPVLERGAQILSDRLVELAEIGPGDRVLDVATGLGEPAVTAARRVGSGGLVEGVDLSPDMLEFARRRAADLGLDNIEFREADGESLQSSGDAYDAILCRWGLMFMGDLAATLANFRDMLKPGGCFAAAVWGPPNGAPALSLGTRVVLASLGLPPPEEAAGTPFALSDVDALRGAFEAAGFSDVRGEWVAITYTFESAEEFARFRRERSRPLEARIAHFSSARRDAAWRAVVEAAQDYADANGTVRMENRSYCVSARR